MKAELTIALDTLWSNQVTVSISAELDNPHSQTTKHLASMMAETLRIYAEEMRSENERTAVALSDLNRRHRNLDDREIAIQRREDLISGREEAADDRERTAGDRDAVLNARENQVSEGEEAGRR